MKNFLIYGMLTCSLIIPAHALPDRETSYQHLSNHPFYPEKNIFGGGEVMGTRRSLTEGRMLIWRSSFTENMYPDIEAFYIVDEDCSEMIGFVDLANSLGICWPESSFGTQLKTNEAVDKIIQNTYPKEASWLLQDIKQAKFIWQGDRLFRMNYPNRIKLDTPITFRIFQGKRFDYILSPIGFMISKTNGVYEKIVKEMVVEDHQLLKKIEADAKKNKPYDL